MVNSAAMGGLHFCQVTIDESGSGGSTCGSEGFDDLDFGRGGEMIQPAGGTFEGGPKGWQSLDINLHPDVAVLEAHADGATVYTITPHNGVAYIEWPNFRGELDLIALDAEGNELAQYRTDSFFN